MTVRAFHDFYAPVDGFNARFTLRCHDQLPAEINPARLNDMPQRRQDKLLAQLDLLNHLLKTLPWAAFRLVRSGPLGAIIEAAEARRAEIYGRLPEVEA